MTDPSRFFTLDEVHALTDEEVRALSQEDFTSALKATQAEGSLAHADATELTLAAEGTARVYFG